MSNIYRTVSDISYAEYTEKRSRFIAALSHCCNEREALDFVAEIRTRHRDARHNIFAYSLRDGGIKRFSDDGEPHGTAGKPALDLLDGSGLTDVVVVVTRYFGGVLLGTGGLSRAYSAAVAEAVKSAATVTECCCTRLEIRCEYSEQGRLNALISGCGGIVDSTVFTDKVTVCMHIDVSFTDSFLQRLCETFSSRVSAKKTGEDFFSL